MISSRAETEAVSFDSGWVVLYRSAIDLPLPHISVVYGLRIAVHPTKTGSVCEQDFSASDALSSLNSATAGHINAGTPSHKVRRFAGRRDESCTAFSGPHLNRMNSSSYQCLTNRAIDRDVCWLNMSYQPDPPESLPKYLAEGLQKQSPTTLREIEKYARQLAEYAEREAEKQLEERVIDQEEEKGVVDTIPDTIPSKACITIKTINENRYYYWQWREGEKIKSQYIKPVTED